MLVFRFHLARGAATLSQVLDRGGDLPDEEDLGALGQIGRAHV